MPSLKEILIPLRMHVLKDQLSSEMKEAADEMKKRLNPVVETVGKIGKATGAAAKQGKSFFDQAKKGLPIIQAIQGMIEKTRNDIEAMTGFAGNIGDTAVGLGTSEERIIQMYHAFGQAGMGEFDLLDSFMGKIQEYAVKKEEEGVDVLQGRDATTYFMDLLEMLDKLPKEQQDAIIAEIFGGKNIIGFQKVLDSWQAAKGNLEKNKSTAISQAQGVRDASAAGDKINYQVMKGVLERMQVYSKEGGFDDIVDVYKEQNIQEMSKAERYRKGELVDSYLLSELINQMQNFIPQLVKALIDGVVAEVPKASNAIEKGIDALFPGARKITNIWNNITRDLGDILQTAKRLLTKRDTDRGDI